MKRLIDIGNTFARNSKWTDYALTKFCLCSMGVMIGTQIPEDKRKKAICASACVFAATYIPLMRKVVQTAVSEEK